METLTARKDEIAGLAAASDERIDAYLLVKEGEIVSLRTFVEDGGARLKYLISTLRTAGPTTFRFSKVSPEEMSTELLERLGFRAAGRHWLYATRATAQ